MSSITGPIEDTPARRFSEIASSPAAVIHAAVTPEVLGPVMERLYPIRRGQPVVAGGPAVNRSPTMPQPVDARLTL